MTHFWCCEKRTVFRKLVSGSSNFGQKSLEHLVCALFLSQFVLVSFLLWIYLSSLVARVFSAEEALYLKCGYDPLRKYDLQLHHSLYQGLWWCRPHFDSS